MTRAPGGRVVVVGSLNVDTTAYVTDFAAPGETITAHGLRIALGGKGTNQAVAAHRFGADVELIARVGDDANARLARDTLEGFGLAIDGIQIDPDEPTGVALITVAASGENTVTVASGANARLSPDAVDAQRDRITHADVVLTQGELPVATVERIAEVASAAGVRFVLNLAPPVGVSATALAVADPLVVNEHEARSVGIAIEADGTDGSWLAAARAAVARGLTRSLVVTLGARGAVAAWATEDTGGVGPGAVETAAVAAPEVDAVDTTGAGDGFTGTLAAAIAEGRGIAEAVALAVAAGSLAVEVRGTVDSYAPRDAVIAAADSASTSTNTSSSTTGRTS